jgi:hypothetical protein
VLLTGEAMVECLVGLLVAPGRGQCAGDDPALHRPRLTFEMQLGQHVTLVDGAEFLGWASWFRVDDETLARLAAGEGEEDWVRARYFPELTRGPHCYIGDAIVAPGAPRTVLRHLVNLVGYHNADALSLSARLCKKDGRIRWAVRYNDGRPAWWLRCQNARWMH